MTTFTLRAGEYFRRVPDPALPEWQREQERLRGLETLTEVQIEVDLIAARYGLTEYMGRGFEGRDGPDRMVLYECLRHDQWSVIGRGESWREAYIHVATKLLRDGGISARR